MRKTGERSTLLFFVLLVWLLVLGLFSRTESMEATKAFSNAEVRP